MKGIIVALFAGIVADASSQVSAADAVSFKEKVLYSFCSQRHCKDGQWPYSAVVAVNGMLYGTTASGGTGRDAACGSKTCGTAFSLDPNTGAETVLHSFCTRPNCADGGSPEALIARNGTLYGATVVGGSGCARCGTVFVLHPATGAEKVLHAFAGGTDGAFPGGSVIDVHGTLYGTTGAGGSTGCGGYGCGTVFALDRKSGAEKILYSFGSAPDGQNPDAGLIDVNGTLYGTTFYGGAAYGSGTVFGVDANTGAEKVLYSFCNDEGCSDGAYPDASLIDMNGTLYGTTLAGGSYGGGTVFAIDPATGAHSIVYSFCAQTNCTDGEEPQSDLIAVNGILYGTTFAGGGSTCQAFANTCGTAFALDPTTGVESVVYSFMGGTDGQNPVAGLIAVSGNLYGTTLGGGGTGCGGAGCGTVFVLNKQR